MKPAAFDYYDPRTTDEALDLLGQLGGDSKPLAGGQSLVPLMNFRLARPASLIDLNHIAELSYIQAAEHGALRIGAMTRQRAIERSSLIAEGWPLVTEAAAQIGHTQIRNRGTVGGSLAHADPAAELPAVALTLEADLVLRGHGAERTLPAEEFFLGYYATALDPAELLVEIRLPAVPPRTGWSFQEVSRRHGDFALAGVAALVTLDAASTIVRVRLAVTGAGVKPIRPRDAEARLLGQLPGGALFHEAAALAVGDLDPETDLHASADYRRHVAQVLVGRALQQAATRATQIPSPSTGEG